MSISITGQDLRELHEHHGNASETVITLGPEGWGIEILHETGPTGQIIAVSQEDVDDYMSGGDEPPTDEDYAAYAENHEHWRIPDQHGRYDTYPADDDIIVVTARGFDRQQSLDLAYWVSEEAVTPVSATQKFGTENVFSGGYVEKHKVDERWFLHRTDTGRYLAWLDSRYMVQPTFWTELTEDEASELQGGEA